MKPITYTEARANFASVLTSATDDLEEMVVTRAGHEPVVLVALSEYEALKETAYLLGNPVNASRLERSVAEHRGGVAAPRELVDVDGSDLRAEPERGRRQTTYIDESKSSASALGSVLLYSDRFLAGKTYDLAFPRDRSWAMASFDEDLVIGPLEKLLRAVVTVQQLFLQSGSEGILSDMWAPAVEALRDAIAALEAAIPEARK
ncbi:type II toxin-antitoxin system Phd/YefM family antitoxin [Nocardia asteroides]|uniref:type II toxin-antitoxin system Phd/YefM family antitoxin n=1 Tax=Nocardia asteroides TaxID=1824 RepID=UPI001E6274BA|nr:type II toxin-antitoxin system prevent-host-death family antitoxin [Nocardia asteroides]UGT63416.1 type II toxin-antitoxin system prevent-host-death family antitoxin [Nocardia asteroides]